MILRILYNLVFIPGLLISWPYFFYRLWRRGNVMRAVYERFAFYRPETVASLKAMERPLWIHAVSVGEVGLAQVLLRELRKSCPDLPVVMTTTTQTGRQVAGPVEDARTVVLYTPLDLWPCVLRFLGLAKPSALVLMEGELWPNMIWESRARGIAVCIVNARLSARSHQRYKKLRWLARHLLGQLSWIAIQSEQDRERFSQAGYPPHKLFLTGSMKFDVAEAGQVDEALASGLRKRVGWSERDPVLMAASTHAGEEKMITEIYLRLRKNMPNLRLLLAPRHFERAGVVEKQCRECREAGGLSLVRRSLLKEPLSQCADVLLLDTTGELRSLLSMATVVFIGKSMLGRGGQNFIEAARFGRPVVAGPHMQNFEVLVRMFAASEAIVQVPGVEELERELRRLLEDGAGREALGQRAREVYGSHVGAGTRCADMVLQTLGLKKA